MEGDRFGESISGVDEIAVRAEHLSEVDQGLSVRSDVVAAGQYMRKNYFQPIEK